MESWLFSAVLAGMNPNRKSCSLVGIFHPKSLQVHFFTCWRHCWFDPGVDSVQKMKHTFQFLWGLDIAQNKITHYSSLTISHILNQLPVLRQYFLGMSGQFQFGIPIPTGNIFILYVSDFEKLFYILSLSSVSVCCILLNALHSEYWFIGNQMLIY